MQKKTVLERSDKMDSCAPSLTDWLFFFPLKQIYILLFALPGLLFCKPEAVGRGILIRAKVEQIGRVFFYEGKPLG